jgi:hypothetical protein
VERSAFHIALAEGDDPESSFFHVARVRGRTLVLGGRGAVLVSTEDGVTADPILGKAIPAPLEGMDEVYGRWPEAACMTGRVADGEHVSGVGYCWARDRWVPAAAWEGAPKFLAPWQGGLLAGGVSPRSEQPAPVNPPRLTFFGADGHAGHVPGSQILALPAATPLGRWKPGLDDVASADGTLFVVAEVGKPERLLVERFSSDAATTTLYELAPREATAHLWVKGARDVVAYGGSTNADERPILSHFDGERWTPLEAPPGIDVVVGYDRSATGTERVFAFRGEALSCWERSAGSRWRSLALPLLEPNQRIDGHWITEDDAWIHVQTPSRRGGGMLLRLRPVKRVYMAGSVPQELAVADGGEVRAAAPPADATPALDPSPFHDAVIGYADRVDSQVMNSLRLCPSGGRTLVCGVTATPLVSTEDGVGSDGAFEQSAQATARGPGEFGSSGPSVVRATDAVFRVEQRGRSIAVRRQRGVAERVDSLGEVGEGQTEVALWARSADDAVAFGQLNDAPLLRRFDGRSWAPIPLPVTKGRVVAFDRAADGSERMFTRDGQAVALFERPRDADAWRPIVLPTLMRGETIHDVWLTNDDAWLLVWPGEGGPTTAGGKYTRAPHLMRMRPVKRVWSYPRDLPDLGW